MNTTFLFSLATDIVVGSTILMVMATSLGLLMKRLSAATRHFYWATLIVSLLLLPAISFLSPKYSLGFLPEERPSLRNHDKEATPASARYRPLEIQSSDSGSNSVNPLPISSVPRPGTFISPSEKIPTGGHPARRALLATWLSGSLGIGFWILAGWFRVRRLVQQSTESTDPDLEASCQKTAMALNLNRPIKIMISDRTMMPLVCRDISY